MSLKILNLQHEKRNNRWHGLYECSCGKTCVTDNSKVRTGKRKSCGCARKEWLSGPGQKYNNDKKLSPEQKEQRSKEAVYRAYKHRADNKKNIKFELTFEEFCSYFDKSCVYCGETLSCEYEGFRYNGIDRIDNSLGYNKDNCVPCCQECNYQKSDYSVEQFLARVRKIVEYQDNQCKNELADLLMVYANKLGVRV